MRQLFLSALLACAALGGGGAAAQSNPVVVELYTSQGCSSCPPADRLLADLAGRDDVIPLALHVDYWDYIGWADIFADPRFTKRQKGYARANGWKMIYTPQMILNGSDNVVGSRPMKVMEGLTKAAQAPAKVDLSIKRVGDELLISASALSPVKPCDIHVVRYTEGHPVDVLRGENAGRRLTYSHIVNAWAVIGDWDGRSDYTAKVKVSGDDPIVVLVQGKRYGSIVAAARLR